MGALPLCDRVWKKLIQEIPLGFLMYFGWAGQIRAKERINGVKYCEISSQTHLLFLGVISYWPNTYFPPWLPNEEFRSKGKICFDKDSCCYHKNCYTDSLVTLLRKCHWIHAIVMMTSCMNSSWFWGWLHHEISWIHNDSWLEIYRFVFYK